MTQLFENNSSSTLLDPIGAGDTLIVLQAGDGAKFPAIGATGDFFAVTLEDVSGNVEIVTCTGRTGDSLTIVRGAEGTTALPFAAGSRAELRVTKETLENFAQKAGDTFTGVITVPGIDYVTTDATTHPVFAQRYNEESGIPTWAVQGPTTEAAAYYIRTYKASGESWEWGIDQVGRHIGTGFIRHKWFEAQTGDPNWYVDQKTTRPAANQMQVQFIPEASALSVSYLFRVVDAGGTSRDIVLNTDGSISAAGDFSFGSLTIPLTNDPSAETIKGEFRDESLYLVGQQRTFIFEPDNLAGDAGDPNTGIAYSFITREANANPGFFTIFPDGGVWGTGDALFDSVSVGDQGAPGNVAPNELCTKNIVEQIAGGAAASGSGYFSEVLFDSPGGVNSGSHVLSNPLITTTPTQITHYHQVIIEAIADTGDYTTITLDTATMRLSTDYVLGSPYTADTSGGAGLQFTSYQNFTAQNPNGGLITRVIGVSFNGDPFP